MKGWMQASTNFVIRACQHPWQYEMNMILTMCTCSKKTSYGWILGIVLVLGIVYPNVKNGTLNSLYSHDAQKQ